MSINRVYVHGMDEKPRGRKRNKARVVVPPSPDVFGEDRAFNDEVRRQQYRLQSGDVDFALPMCRWADYGMAYCYVYVITPDNLWPSKVGYSIDVNSRLIGLQIACWRPLQIFAAGWCVDVEQAKALESAVHERLSSDGLSLLGEWFDMRAPQAWDMVKFTAEVCGVEFNDTHEDPDIAAAEARRLERLYSACGKLIPVYVKP